MIFVENSYSPLTVVGVLPETAPIPSEFGCDMGRLWSNEIVLFALVVPGCGRDALAAYREVLEWLRKQQCFICRRRCAFAWVIEDATLRASTRAWLALVRNAGWTGCGEVFHALRSAVAWLGDTAASWMAPSTDIEWLRANDVIVRPRSDDESDGVAIP